MACNKFKAKDTCSKVYATCTAYEGEVPEFSSLFEDGCLTIEETTTDIYGILEEIKEEINLTTLESTCVTIPVTPTTLNIFQTLLDFVCAQQEAITAQATTITEMQQQIADLQTQTCP